MLYYIAMHDVQMLLLCFMSVMLIAGTLSIYIPSRTYVAAFVMLLIFAVGYYTLIVSTALTGKPTFDTNGMSGLLGGFIGFDHDGEQYIAILINTQDGPKLFSIPYSEQDNQSLQEGMQKYIESGVPQVINGKQGNEQSEGKKTGNDEGAAGEEGQEGGMLEVYDFAQDQLPIKQP